MNDLSRLREEFSQRSAENRRSKESIHEHRKAGDSDLPNGTDEVKVYVHRLRNPHHTYQRARQMYSWKARLRALDSE